MDGEWWEEKKKKHFRNLIIITSTKGQKANARSDTRSTKPLKCTSALTDR